MFSPQSNTPFINKYLNKMVWNCNFLIYNFFQKSFFEWKPYLANIFCKNLFSLQVEVKTHCYLRIFYTKGQFIFKCLFGMYLQFFPKKRTKKFDSTTMVSQVELFSFVFWENWRHQKDISKLTDFRRTNKLGRNIFFIQ